jgi:hypothetical protein
MTNEEFELYIDTLSCEVIEDQKSIIDETNKWIDQTDLSCNTVQRKQKWEAAWGDINNSLEESFSLEKLTPNYFKYNILRYKGNFIKAKENFELDFYTKVRHHYFDKYLKDAENVVEFGAGTGHNLVLLSKINRYAMLTATDMAFSTRDIIKKINREHGMHISWLHFDMMKPECSWVMDKVSVMTMHSMEQLGLNFTKFVDFLIEKKPKICFHIEPIYELYTDSEFDLLAKKYHLKKGYLVGLLDYLKSKNVDIIEQKRLDFGSQYHEGYSVIVWKPK